MKQILKNQYQNWVLVFFSKGHFFDMGEKEAPAEEQRKNKMTQQGQCWEYPS